MIAAFSPEGMLAQSKDFEYRPQQQQIAGSIASALAKDQPLLIEAGTGVGKSLAYLIPAAEFTHQTRRKAVVSTHTINLQEQLFYKDVRLVEKILGRNIFSVLLKGQQNYVCKLRLKRAVQQSSDLFQPRQAQMLQHIEHWAMTSTEGSLSTLNFRPDSLLWSQVNVQDGLCIGRRCPMFQQCAYMRSRKAAADADLVVMNHTLFFGMLQPPGEMESVNQKGFIFNDDYAIIDEAHCIEDVASRMFGFSVTQGDFIFQLQRLFNPQTKKGTLVSLNKANLLQDVEFLLNKTRGFFSQFNELLDKDSQQTRLRKAPAVADTLSEYMEALVSNLVELADERAEMEFENAERSFSSEWSETGRKLQEYMSNVRDFLKLEKSDDVYWLEQSRSARENSVGLSSARVEVANELEQVLFNAGRAVILASATLSAGDANFKYFRSRSGARYVAAVQVPSPFDYARQMHLYVAKDMPMADRSEEYKSMLEAWIAKALQYSNGRAFVLFTSFQLLGEMARRLLPLCQKQGWSQIVHGADMTRDAMLTEFRKDTHSVLFGTDSFWTGVDVPGEALSNVIIVNLPFDVPTKPMVAARRESIEARGGKAFFEYNLPEAVMKFRQGVGRLIRTQKDRGSVFVLDSRVIHKSYGRNFLASIDQVKARVVSLRDQLDEF